MRSTLFSIKNKKKLCVAVTTLALALKIREKRKRKCWSRNWLLQRNKLGCYENLMRELALQDAEGYRKWLRMDTASFEYLLKLVTPLIAKRDTILREAIPAGERLALTLRYLATGETQSSLAYQFRIAQNTISGIIPTVCDALYFGLKQKYLSSPTTELEWRTIAKGFKEICNFPMCIGAMDGKHIKIVPPPGSGSTYFNYKGDFSIVLLALVDASLKFTYVDVGTNGRISDGGVWDKCDLKEAIESSKLNIPGMEALPNTINQVPHVIVADDAFPLSTYIMKPYPGKNLELKQHIFNYRVSRARRVAENAFGILAMRFRIFQTKISSSVSNTKKIVLACCALHNFLRMQSSTYITPGLLDNEDINSRTFTSGEWRSMKNGLVPLKKTGRKYSQYAKKIQTDFLQYFNSVGAVPWQSDMCLLH